MIVSSCGTEVPPKSYGGLEWCSAIRAKELHRRGYDVTIGVTLDSDRKFYPKGIKLVPTVASRMQGIPEKEMFETLNARIKWDQFDIVIDDSHGLWTKTVQGNREHWYAMPHDDPSHFGAPPPVTRPGIVCPSYDCASAYEEKFGMTVFKRKGPKGEDLGDIFFGAFARTNHHGIPIKEYKYSAKGGSRYLFLGRIQSIKGVQTALDICKDLDLPLDIVGADDHMGPAEQNQFVQRIKAQCDGKKWRYIGKVSQQEKVSYLRNAKAMIAPSCFREPLGLMSLESQACGTPAIVSGAGGLPETVRHGRTGLVFTNLAELRNQLLAIEEGEIKLEKMRSQAREWIESHWTVEKNVDRWEAIFKSAPF